MLTQNEKVINYYSATLLEYENVWYTPKSLALHFGYYDETTRSHSDSLVKINEVLSNMANITHNDYVLDAGCGVGGTAIWLAKNIHCNVVGVNITSPQLQKAIIYAQDNNVLHLTRFEKQDFTCTTFENSTFSVVWIQEAFSHTDCKQQFMNEAYRVLGSNGRLLIADYALRESPDLTKKELDIYTTWMDGWAVHGLLTLKQYESIILQAGFNRIEIHDITKNTTPSLLRLHRMSRIYAYIIRIVLKFGLDKKMSPRNKLFCQNILGAYYQYKALKSGVWNYVVIIAYKN